MTCRLQEDGAAERRVDLNDTLCEALGDLDALIARSGASTFQMDRLPTIRADPKRMRRLLHALISNALTFSRSKRPPRIVISGRLLPGGLVEIAVRENEVTARGRPGGGAMFSMTVPRGRRS